MRIACDMEPEKFGGVALVGAHSSVMISEKSGVMSVSHAPMQAYTLVAPHTPGDARRDRDRESV